MFEIRLIFYGLSSILQFSQFVWPLSFSVWDVFNNFLLIDATDRSKISSDQKRFFIALSLYPLSFFTNTPFKSFSMSNKSFKYSPYDKAWLAVSNPARKILILLSHLVLCVSIKSIKWASAHTTWRKENNRKRGRGPDSLCLTSPSLFPETREMET